MTTTTYTAQGMTCAHCVNSVSTEVGHRRHLEYPADAAGDYRPEPLPPSQTTASVSDLGYLHVHPQGRLGDGATAAGPALTFDVDVPTAGAYRLFLDFQHDGVVRTAAFTATAT